MGFFKNINIDIEDRPTGSDVQIGDVGKMTYTRKLLLNYKTTTHESPHVKYDEIVEVCTRLNAFPQFEENGIYIYKLRETYRDIPLHYMPLSPLESADMYIPYGQVIYKTTYDRCEEKYERFYKVEKISNHPDAAHFKRPDTIIRHACRDCAFYGRCQNAPECNTRYIRELRPINDLNGAIYFKYDKKNDKLINHDITPQIREDTKSVRMHEWLESMSPDQRIKCQEAIKFLKIHESHNWE